MKFIGVVLNKGAKDAGSLILTSRTSEEGFISVEVVHSSHHMLPVRQCSEGRKTRSVGMACIDSRDEEMITEKEKERLIKELFGIDNVKDLNAEIEAYGNEIIAVDSKRVHTTIVFSKINDSALTYKLAAFRG